MLYPWYPKCDNEDSDQNAKAQVDRNLRRAHMSEGMFSDVVANLFYIVLLFI